MKFDEFLAAKHTTNVDFSSCTCTLQCQIPPRFSHARGGSCNKAKHKPSDSAPTCANWPHAKPRKPNRRMVWPLPYEKLAEGTRSSGKRNIQRNLIGTLCASPASPSLYPIHIVTSLLSSHPPPSILNPEFDANNTLTHFIYQVCR